MASEKAVQGDRVKITAKDEVIEGILIQSPDKNVTIVKLKSGYNVGIENSKIKEIKIIEKHKAGKTEEKAVKQDKSLPKLSILHTGGTIASKVDYKTGAVIARFSPDEIMSMVPELKNIANIDSRLVSNMFSEDMRFGHYNVLAKEIEKELKKGAEGIIITHGTDTMHYTAAALSFMIENPPVPIIIVGAQRSSDRGSSDAFQNLTGAAYFAAKMDFAGVAICMHYKSEDDICAILPGTKSRKMHSSRRDAFQPVNAMPIALVNTKTKAIDMLAKSYPRKDSSRKPKITFIDEKLKIGVLKAHPNLFSAEVSAYSGFDGLVLEGTGLGHMPINEIDELTKENSKVKKEIEKLIKDGTIVVMSSQTIYGRVDMNVYSTGRILQDIGVLGNLSDMTPETSLIKLA